MEEFQIFSILYIYKRIYHYTKKSWHKNECIYFQQTFFFNFYFNS